MINKEDRLTLEAENLLDRIGDYLMERSVEEFHSNYYSYYHNDYSEANVIICQIRGKYCSGECEYARGQRDYYEGE